MAISTGIDIRVYKGAKTHTDMTGEAMTDSGDHKRYAITNRAKRYWDDSHAFTVKVAGVTVTTGFTIENPGGEIVFDASQGASAVTVDGAYFAIDKSFMLTATDLRMSYTMAEATIHGDRASRNYPTLFTASMGQTGMHEDDTQFDRLAGKYIAVYCESGVYQAAQIDSGSRFEFYARLISNKIAGAGSKDLLKDVLGLVNEGPVYHRSD